MALSTLTRSDGDPLRVLLWSVPRSLSTVFEKCMSFVPNTQVINEPFSCAYFMGPDKRVPPDDFINAEQEADYKKSLEKINVDLPMAFESDDCTFGFVKEILEADYPGKRLIFCKDMAFALYTKYDMIPKGYRHTFVIRHPYRMLPSYKKLMAPFYMATTGKKDFRMCDLPAEILPKGYTFQEQYELMKHLQNNGDETDPIIIDADDLLKNPASILRQYFTLLGIPYTDDLLEWPAGKDIIKSWKAARDILLGNFHEWGGYYDTALNSTGFHPLKEMPHREDLSEDILECADFCMPYYQKMYDLRIRP